MSSTASFSVDTDGLQLVLRPSPNARVMRLRVDPRTGAVVLSYPRRVSARRALAWATGQRGWIEAAVAAVPAAIALQPGAEIAFRGEPHLIAWEAGALRKVTICEGHILVGGPRELIEARLLRWLRREALVLMERETREFAVRACVTVDRVGVGDPVSRWGSCAAAGGIRYSWRLILAPDWVRRATVAHEVAHRVHMNHGPVFHALVAEILGSDPKPARDWLRRHGAGLHRVGRP